MDWVVADPANHEFFKSYEEVFDKSALYTYPEQEHRSDPLSGLAEQKSSGIGRHRFLLTISAAALLLLAGLIWMWKEALPEKHSDGRQQVVQREWRSVEVPLGKKASVLLPDSSTVQLKGGSVLRYEHPFADSIRRVELAGEGFFEVRSRPGQAFRLQSASLQIDVLGTTFNVKDFAEEDRISVHLMDGKVAVAERQPSGEIRILSQLKPQQRLQYSRSSQSYEVERFAKADAPAWRENRLNFKNERLNDISRELTRLYGIKIRIVDGALGRRRYSSRFNAATSLHEVLDVLAAAQSFRYRYQGEELIIYP